jgi:hypothetical protein
MMSATVTMGNDFDRWNTINKATDAADETARLHFPSRLGIASILVNWLIQSFA